MGLVAILIYIKMIKLNPIMIRPESLTIYPKKIYPYCADFSPTAITTKITRVIQIDNPNCSLTFPLLLP
jgi:hypothetical protein